MEDIYTEDDRLDTQEDSLYNRQSVKNDYQHDSNQTKDEEEDDKKDENLYNFEQLQVKEHFYKYVVPESEFKKDKICSVCEKNIDGLLQTRKNCYYCGESVCPDCSKRKRENPKKKEEFLRICDNCHQQVLYSKIMDIYLERKQKRDDYSTKVEKQYEYAQQQLQQKQQQLDSLKNEALQREKLVINNQQELQDQIDINNNKIQQVEFANNKLNEEFSDINNSINEITERTKQQKQEYDNLLEQLDKLNKELEEKQNQINKLNQLYHNTDQIISTIKSTGSNNLDYSTFSERKAQREQSRLQRADMSYAQDDSIYQNSEIQQSYTGDSFLQQNQSKRQKNKKKQNSQIKPEQNNCECNIM